MQETRIKLGKFWKERLEKNLRVPKSVTKDHDYIKEYEASVVQPQVNKPEVKPKKVR